MTTEFTTKQLTEEPILQYFRYEHLPRSLHGVSEGFCRLARLILSDLPSGSGRTAALRALLEARGAVVRANVK